MELARRPDTGAGLTGAAVRPTAEEVRGGVPVKGLRARLAREVQVPSTILVGRVAALSHVSRRIGVVRLKGGPDSDGTWHDERVDPFRDHERIFGAPAAGIGTIGIMQDTDQTLEAASAELRALAFAPAPVGHQ